MKLPMKKIKQGLQKKYWKCTTLKLIFEKIVGRIIDNFETKWGHIKLNNWCASAEVVLKA